MKTNVYRKAISIGLGLIMASSLASAGNGNSGDFPGSNGQPFQAMQQQIDDLNQSLAEQLAAVRAQIDDLQQQIDEQGMLIEDVEERNELQDQLISLLQASIAQLGAQVSANEADIESLQLWHELQGELIAALDERLSNLEARVEVNEGDIAALILADQAMQQGIGAIETQIEVIQQLVINNTGDIGALQAELELLESRLAAAELELQSKQDRIADACPAGSSIRKIAENGNVTCEIDDVSSGVGTLSTVDVQASIALGKGLGGKVTATCPSNYQLTGGGHSFSLFSTLILGSNGFYGSNNGWEVIGVNPSPLNGDVLYSYAVCARVE